MTADVGENVDFDPIVDRIIGLVSDLAPAYAAPTQVIDRQGSLGLLSGDQATALAMVVSELLHNAVEHAEAAQISVGLQRRAAFDGDEVVVEVVDDGRGLPPEFDAGVTGLGLTIVQSLVTGDLRGTCTFDRPTTGTRVVVAFPADRVR
jgi:two-component sensor histidine kinase